MGFDNGYQKDASLQYDCLLFDVDDTLYSKHSGVSAKCTEHIIEYMIQKLGINENEVSDLNSQLYNDYGTTMAGLRAVGYNFEHDDYHRFVHGRLPYELLKPDPVLRNLLRSLPIRKVIFSNGDKVHVAKVLSRLGLEDCFEGVICFETLNPSDSSNDNDENDDHESGDLRPEKSSESESVSPKTPIVCKPFKDAFEQTFKLASINPQKTLFFDDSVRNIQSGKQLGLQTVLVGTPNRVNGADYALESIHNIREALPELWEANNKAESVEYSTQTAVETYVTA